MRMNPKKMIVGILLLVLIGSVGTAYSILRDRDHHMLRIAFMNGYVEALNLSVEEMKMLKKDKGLMYKAVNRAADRYLNRVNRLNR